MNPTQHPSSPLIELCTGSIEDVILAAELQVDRIELNCQLDFGSVVRDGVYGYGTADRGQLCELISIASKISMRQNSAEPAN